MTIQRYIKTEYGNVSYILNDQFEDQTVFRDGANGKSYIFWIDQMIILNTKIQNGKATGTSYFYDLRGNTLKRILKGKSEKEIMDLIGFVQNRFKKKYENRTKRIIKKKESVSNKKKKKNLKVEQDIAYRKVKDALQEQIKMNMEETRNLNCPLTTFYKNSSIKFETFKPFKDLQLSSNNAPSKEEIQFLIKLSEKILHDKTQLSHLLNSLRERPCEFNEKSAEMDEIQTQSGDKVEKLDNFDHSLGSFRTVIKK